MLQHKTTRRRFLKHSTALAAAWCVAGHETTSQARSPNQKLNIGVIGCGGRGFADLQGCATENIVALCDVDEARAAQALAAYPKAKRYHDYRQMLEKQRDLDAVVVATPDHHHAPATIMAMKLGKHVYCEKPLTHSVYEARVMRQVARKQKLATQMGNQGHSYDSTRQIVEIVRSGAIGSVRHVHVWTDRPGRFWEQPLDRPSERPPIPRTLQWDLWLGPAPERPYHPTYVPHNWRAWWDFGTGALGDMGCHVMDAAFWALDLGSPTAIEAQSPNVHSETGPAWEIITYEFPARGDQPAVTMKWYDAGKVPPQELADGQPLPHSGSLLIGDEGTMYIPDAWGRKWKLLPEEKFADYKPPEPTIHRAGDPYIEWIASCKGGPPALSQFDYSAVLTETVLLGIVAVRVGKRIEWDAENMKARSAPEAEAFVKREYRKGWTL